MGPTLVGSRIDEWHSYSNMATSTTIKGLLVQAPVSVTCFLVAILGQGLFLIVVLCSSDAQRKEPLPEGLSTFDLLIKVAYFVKK